MSVRVFVSSSFVLFNQSTIQQTLFTKALPLVGILSLRWVSLIALCPFCAERGPAICTASTSTKTQMI